MKLYGCYTVLNEEDYLETSIRSMINVVDRIIVIHGSTMFAPLTRAGLSVDATGDILVKLEKEFPGKLETFRIGRVEDRIVLQNAFIDRVPEGAFVLLSGADEIWKEEELSSVRRNYLEDDHYVELYIKQIELRHDFKHRLPIEFQPGSLFFDEKGDRFSNGYIQERLYQRIPGEDVRYRNNNHTHVQDKDGLPLYANKKYEKRRRGYVANFYHCARLCSLDKFRLKCIHVRLQNHYERSWSDLTTMEKKFEIEQADGIYTQTLRIPEKLKELEHGGFSLPKILKSHPFYGKRFDEIPRDQTYALQTCASSDS